MPVTPSGKKKSKAAGKPAKGTACPSCGAAAVSKARYCHACGASLKGGTGGAKWSAGGLAVVGAVVAVIVVAVVVAMMLSQRDTDSPSSSAEPAPNFDAPPDLSQMTPREAADRLFNRIMMASEQGDRAEAMSFAPMAIEAYGNLPALDRDARYHLGLIHNIAGDRANVERQIAGMRQGAPNHLLALVLEHRLAEQSGDLATVSRILASFAAAYDTEIAMRRPEYEGHANTVQRYREIAASTTTPSGAEPSGAGQNSAELFAANCAGCHGPRAAGSDKGPPLVHKIYEPSHHGDESFHRAVRQGVRAHHWTFGNMPPVAGVSDDELDRIIAYVRGLQKAAGIE
jgi:mono/diheme cytochrome c family protein